MPLAHCAEAVSAAVAEGEAVAEVLCVSDAVADGVPVGLVDLDAVIMLFSSAPEILSRFSINEEFESVQAYCTDREGIRSVVMAGLNISKDLAKELLLVLSNG